MINIFKINDEVYIDDIVIMRKDFMNECINVDKEYDWTGFIDASRDYFIKGINDDSSCVFAATEDDKIVGYAAMSYYTICPTLNNLSGKSAILTDMYVIPEYRRKGISLKILNKIMDYARCTNIRKVTLNATEQGRFVYEKYGFIDISGEMCSKLK